MFSHTNELSITDAETDRIEATLEQAGMELSVIERDKHTGKVAIRGFCIDLRNSHSFTGNTLEEAVADAKRNAKLVVDCWRETARIWEQYNDLEETGKLPTW